MMLVKPSLEEALAVSYNLMLQTGQCYESDVAVAGNREQAWRLRGGETIGAKQRDADQPGNKFPAIHDQPCEIKASQVMPEILLRTCWRVRVEITSRSISFDYQLVTEVELSLVVCTFGLSPDSNCCTDVRLS
jgi:hypothetical protein